MAEIVEVCCGDVARFTVPLDTADGPWMVLRLAESDTPTVTPGQTSYPANNHAIAYPSPWFLEPGP